MPLSEVPSNHPARNGSGQSQDDLQADRSRTGTPNGDENLEILKNPSSIQSMLRNTTETGNVGQFSIKPSRVPPSLPRPLKARTTPIKQRQPGAYYNRNEDSNVRHPQSHLRQGTTVSDGSALQTQIPRPYRGPARSPSIEDFRSYSSTRSSYVGHSLTPRHPHSNGGHGGSGGPHNLRPRSPFAYPTRLKRPGYRPSSPALSEFHKQNRSQTSLHRRPSFRTNSPSSLHTNGASPWRKGVNRSDPMLRHYQHFAVPTSGRVPSPSPTSTRPTTPKGSPNRRSVASSANGHQTTLNGSWNSPPSPARLPIFYDYTETFEERGVEQQDYSQYVSMSTGTLAERPVLDTGTTTYYELDASPEITSRTDVTSEYSLPKLETQATDNKFDQTTSQFDVNDHSSIQVLHKDLSEVPELPEGDLSSSEVDLSPAKRDDGPHDQDPQSPKQASPPLEVAESSKQSLNEVPSRGSVSDVETSEARVSGSPQPQRSSLVDSVHSAHTTPQTASVREDPFPKDSRVKPDAVASLPPIVLAAADSVIGDGPVGEKRDSVQLVRASSSDDHSGYEHTITEILSPTPERSMTSPTSVSRFSKILSINDDMLDLDELANRIKGKDRAESPMQGIADSRARLTRIEPSWRKRSVQLRDVATRQNAAGYALVEASDSEDEPELTQGLRQTFCKPENRPVDYRPRSPPIVLPSQLVRRGYPGPLSIRRSPAVRRSTSDLRKVRDSPNVDSDQDNGSPKKSPTYRNRSLEVNQSRQVQLNVIQHLESPRRKLSTEESSTPSSKPLPPFSPPSLPPPNKELPLIPNERPAIVSLSPPITPRLPSLPFSFTPLIQRGSEDETISAAELEAVASLASSYVNQGKKSLEDRGITTPKSANRSPERGSIASRPDSRPWNLDTSYPWSDQQPKLEVTMPEPPEDPNGSTGSLPRFRLNVQRASSITEITEKPTKHRQVSDALSSPFTSSHDVVEGTMVRRNRYPNLSVMPGQINSSHDVFRSSPNQTRFVESFEIQSPRITLVPPSPGFEARSFFSDDSSQLQPRGIFKKRISALRNRRSRAASADEPRGYDRGLLNSALGRSRASGRTSRQSENTAITAGASSHASQSRRARLKFVNKLRSWWQRSEDRVRLWRWRRRYNGAYGRSASADLFAGV